MDVDCVERVSITDMGDDAALVDCFGGPFPARVGFVHRPGAP